MLGIIRCDYWLGNFEQQKGIFYYDETCTLATRRICLELTSVFCSQYEQAQKGERQHLMGSNDSVFSSSMRTTTELRKQITNYKTLHIRWWWLISRGGISAKTGWNLQLATLVIYKWIIKEQELTMATWPWAQCLHWGRGWSSWVGWVLRVTQSTYHPRAYQAVLISALP